MQNTQYIANRPYNKQVKEAGIIFFFGLPLALCLLLMQKHNLAVALVGILFSLVLFFNYNSIFYFLVFALPFTGVGFIEVGVTILPSQAIGMIGVTAFLFYKQKTKFIKTSGDDLLILFFVVAVLISIVKYQAAMDTNPDVWGGSLRNSLKSPVQIMVLGLMIGIYFFTVNFLTSKERVIKAIKILLLTTFITCLYGIYQAVGYHLNWPYVMSTQELHTACRIIAVQLQVCSG